MARYSTEDFGRWLRQRKAIRAAGRDRFTPPPGDADFFDEDGNPTPHEPGKYFGCLVVATLILIFFFGAWYFACDPFGGREVGVVVSPTLATTTTVPPSTTSTSGATTTTTRRFEHPGPVSDAMSGLGQDPATTRAKIIFDVFRDLINSSDDDDAGHTGDEIDIIRAMIWASHVSLERVEGLFNRSVYECGAEDPVVVCAAQVLPMPEGDILVVAVEHAAAVPARSTERSYIYSLVFDSDGDPANNWVFRPPFNWDFFQGTDRWYQAIYSHDTESWIVGVNQVQADGNASQPLPSSVRVVIEGEWVIWYIPSSEIPAFPGLLRATAFAHDGAFGAATRGGDVTGADPTEPLFDPEG